MEHLVLFGDSVFDNKSYVGSGLSVIEHLRAIMPADWTATLCAVDGNTTQGISQQIRKVPADTISLFVSVGGNDALPNMSLLSDMTIPGPLLLDKLSEIADTFSTNYSAAISSICELHKPTFLCTIYHGNFERSIARAAKTAVGILNDIIYSVANEKRLAVIDLRRICTQTGDYANPIEPSAEGGKKIARAICEKVIGRQQYLKRMPDLK